MGQKPVMSVANENALALQAQGLAKRLGGLQLFSGLNLQVLGGEALVIRGTNGSGKTTLLRMLAGLLDADSGTISLRSGMQILDETDNSGHIHYFGHANALKAAQTTRANLVFWRDYLSEGAGLDHEQNVEAVAERVDAAHLLDLPVLALSAGQKRRVGFARLLLAHRPIWLLDEPTAALDASSSELIEKLVGEHLDGGGLAIAATHLPFLQDRAQTLDMADFKRADETAQVAETLDW